MWTSRVLRAIGLVLLLAVTGLASARDHDGDDDGDYRVVRAWYGAGEQSMDVTRRLRELVRQDRRFQVSNEMLGGDPAPGQWKTLVIQATDRHGRMRNFEYREGNRIDGDRFTAWARPDGDDGGWHHGGRDEGYYAVISASYGTSRRQMDVTGRVMELVRRDGGFSAANDTLGGDPDRGRNKVLRIEARGRDGQTRIFEYPEGATVDGRLFSARGGWGGPVVDQPQTPMPYGELQILQATYGIGRHSMDVTARLQSLVRGPRFEARVDNDLAGGDPARGENKTLWIRYRLGNGRSQQVSVNEGDWLRLP